jgi:hypothetical protein
MAVVYIVTDWADINSIVFITFILGKDEEGMKIKEFWVGRRCY